MTDLEKFAAVHAKVYFVIAFRTSGSQVIGAHLGPYVDHDAAIRWARAESRVDGQPSYVVGVDVASMVEIRP